MLFNVDAIITLLYVVYYILLDTFASFLTILHRLPLACVTATSLWSEKGGRQLWPQYLSSTTATVTALEAHACTHTYTIFISLYLPFVYMHTSFLSFSLFLTLNHTLLYLVPLPPSFTFIHTYIHILIAHSPHTSSFIAFIHRHTHSYIRL